MGIIYKAGNTYANKIDQSDLSPLVERGNSSQMHIYCKQTLDLLGMEGTFFKEQLCCTWKNGPFFFLTNFNWHYAPTEPETWKTAAKYKLK